MKRRVLLAALCAFGLLAGYAGWRISKRPEFLIRFGTPEQQVWAVRQFGLAGKSGPALKALASPVPSVRHAAIAALEGLAHAHTRDLLLAVAREDSDATVRLRALEAAVGLAPEASDAELQAGLSDDVGSIRAASVRLVQRHARRDLLAGVLSLSTDSDPEVSQAVLDALVLLQAPIRGESSLPAVSGTRVIWEAERGFALRDNFERAGPQIAESADPLFEGLGGHSGEGWIRCLQGAGSNHPHYGGRTGELLIGHIRYPIVIPEDGDYQMYVRMWFMDKCGDSIRYWIDHGRERLPNQNRYGGGSKEWRNWIWFRDSGGPVRLAAGLHTVYVEPREDGVRLDQFCLARVDGEHPSRHSPALASTQDPLLLSDDGCEVSISRESLVIGDDGELRGSVFAVRRGEGALAAVLEIDSGDAALASPDKLPISFVENRATYRDFCLSFRLDAACRERKMTVTLSPRPSGEPAKAELIITKPWPWQLAGPFSFRDDPLSHLGGDWTTWLEHAHTTLYDRFAFMDFQQVYGRRARGLVVMRARIRCEDTGDYLWLLNSDDEAKVWLNGSLAMENRRNLPAPHTLVRKTIHLEAGEYEIEAAVWQRGFHRIPHLFTATQNYWQFRLRIRVDPNTPAPIIGIPWDQ
jgi:hypothetical protein